MRSWIIAIVAVAVVALLGTGLYLFTTKPPAPPPAPTVEATAMPSPSPVAPGGRAEAALVEMDLPAGWQFLVDQWPPDAAMDTPHVTPQLFAWRDGAGFTTSPTRLSIISLEWNQLPIDQYLADLEQQLGQSPGVSDVVTAVTTELRQDGLPAGRAMYTIETETGRFNGAQVVTLDTPAQHLVIFSLVAPAEAGTIDDLLQELMQTVRFRE